MSDPTATRFIDSVKAKIPVWMSRSIGFRFLTSMIILCDIGAQTLLEALYLRYPTIGTPTGLSLAGQSRGLIRGMADTDLLFGQRLIGWLDAWRIAGTQEAIARRIHEYVAGNPMVRVVNRGGTMTTVAADGTKTVNYGVAWNWDSHDSPHRAGFWSELWVIIYVPPWNISGTVIGDLGVDLSNKSLGLGHLVPRAPVDAIKGLLDQWKAAHSRVRMVIWTYDNTLFDPTNSGTLPDGWWGNFSKTVAGACTKSNRSESCRYWEVDRSFSNP